jgi:hypothetical protein
MALAAPTTPPPFPRIATVNYSSPQNYDSLAFQSNLAKFNISILSIWPGWENGRAMNMQQVVTNIKKLNSQTSVFLYISNNEVAPNAAPMADLTNKLNAMHWWLYPSGTSGAPVASAWSGTLETNNTLFTAPDSNGDRWVEWYAKWAAQSFYVPSPSIDGFFTDNVFYRPRVNGDWNLDGVTDSNSNLTVDQWYRDGYNRHFAVLNQVMPGKLQIGNVADWGGSTVDLTGYTGMLNGGFIEGAIGYPYSSETWGGWSEMMREYRKIMAALAAPKMLIFGQAGTATDYQTFRYGFASCLMDDGYFQFSIAGNEYSGTIWFDEYNVQLGNATTGPATSAWQNGVYRRDYQNGIVLVNPKGNGPQTVQLETNFKHFSGTQAAAINNGQVVKSVTLNDRDGIVLLRIQPISAPAPVTTTAQPLPPGSVIVQ